MERAGGREPFDTESPLVISKTGAMKAVCFKGRLQTIKKIIYPPSLVMAAQAEVTEASRAEIKETGRPAGFLQEKVSSREI